MGIGEDTGRHGAVFLGHQPVSNKNNITDQGQKAGRYIRPYVFAAMSINMFIF